MTPLDQFVRSCPVGLRLYDEPNPDQSYKYLIAGKSCTLGVLFEDSVNVYFEWLTERGERVTYAPEIRYKSWPKREVARLVSAGIWEVTGAPCCASD